MKIGRVASKDFLQTRLAMEKTLEGLGTKLILSQSKVVDNKHVHRVKVSFRKQNGMWYRVVENKRKHSMIK